VSSPDPESKPPLAAPPEPAAEREMRELVARVTRAVTARAGGRAVQGRGELAAIVASEVAAAVGAEEKARGRTGKRAVVTTTGKNARGVVAKIAQAIADAGGDILDISQTLISDYFTMIIVVDTSALEVTFAEFKAGLVRTVSALGAECLVMHEDIVNALQRV
jgi:ACT domain-containing protein